jgi:hypothetical protein
MKPLQETLEKHERAIYGNNGTPGLGEMARSNNQKLQSIDSWVKIIVVIILGQIATLLFALLTWKII